MLCLASRVGLRRLHLLDQWRGDRHLLGWRLDLCAVVQLRCHVELLRIGSLMQNATGTSSREPARGRARARYKHPGRQTWGRVPRRFRWTLAAESHCFRIRSDLCLGVCGAVWCGGVWCGCLIERCYRPGADKGLILSWRQGLGSNCSFGRRRV